MIGSDSVAPSPLHGGPNPFEGIPFRGDQVHVKADDPPHMQPQVTHDAHVKIFDFSNPDHLKEYEAIIQSCASGKSVMGIEELEYCDKIKTWRAFIRWYDQFVEAPEAKKHAQTNWTGQS